MEKSKHRRYLLHNGSLLKDKYTIESVISSGGSSVTYKASYNNSFFCVKECYPSILNNNIVRLFDGNINFTSSLTCSKEEAEKQYNAFCTLFENEKKIVEGLQLKNKNKDYSILGVCDAFYEKGFYYIIYETADNISLAELIKTDCECVYEQEKISGYLEILKKILLCLNDLHTKKARIHCDISPENILLMNEEQQTLRIVDFASSYKIGEEKHNRVFSSRHGYSPIELLQYSKGNVDYSELSPATDTFSVAAIAYKIFTGTTLEPSSSVIGDWKDKVTKKCKIQSDIIERIIAIIEKGINNDSALRYLSAKEMTDDIQSVLDAIITAPVEKRKRKVIRIATTVICAIIMLVVAGFVCEPNYKVWNANRLFKNGSVVEAYEELKSVYENKKFFHLFYPENEMKELAQNIYMEKNWGTIAKLDFESNIVQAVKSEDVVTAFLDNNKIVSKNITTKQMLFEIEVAEQKVLLSHDGKFYATISQDDVLSIYNIVNKKTTCIDMISNVKNFTFTEDTIGVFYIKNDNTWGIYDLRTFETIMSGSNINDCLPYENNLKLLDANTKKMHFAFVSSENEIIIKDFDETLLYTVNYDKSSKPKQIQLANDYSTTIKIYTDKVFEYNYQLDRYCASSFDNYSYYFNDTGKILQYVNSTIITTQDNVVTCEKYNPDGTTHIRGYSQDIYDIRQLQEYCGVSGNYYYDYSFDKNILYRTNIQTKESQEIYLKTEDSVFEEFVVMGNTICTASKNKLSFYKISDNTAYKYIDDLEIDNARMYDFSNDDKTIAVCSNGKIKVFKYENGWHEYSWYEHYNIDNLPNGEIIDVEINSEGSQICLQTKSQNENLITRIDLEKQVEISRIKSLPVEKISDDGNTAVGINGHNIYIVDIAQEKQLKMFKMSEYCYDVLHSDEYLPHIVHFDNNNVYIETNPINRFKDKNKLLINDRIVADNIVSTIEKISSHTICFMQEENKSVYLIFFDTVKNKVSRKMNMEKTDLMHIAKLHNYDYILYDLYSPKDNHLSITGFIRNDNNSFTSVSMLYIDYTLDELMQMCEERI